MLVDWIVSVSGRKCSVGQLKNVVCRRAALRLSYNLFVGVWWRVVHVNESALYGLKS
jgi:hypothetical protein